MKNEKSIILSLRNVGLSYTRRQGIFRRNKYWALRDVSLDLYNGETLGIIGKNGVGKSTLLKVIAGIISPDRGEMVVWQKEMKISLISLQAGFNRNLSGRENAILSGMLLGATKDAVMLHINDIISFSELNEFIDEPVGTYSTGMLARLGFSVAYYVNPDVILLDEVLGVGDEIFRIKSTDAMKKRILSDKTVVLVSHNVKLVGELCNRVVWIEEGMMKSQGNVADVLQDYIDSTVPNKNHPPSNTHKSQNLKAG